MKMQFVCFNYNNSVFPALQKWVNTFCGEKDATPLHDFLLGFYSEIDYEDEKAAKVAELREKFSKVLSEYDFVYLGHNSESDSDFFVQSKNEKVKLEVWLPWDDGRYNLGFHNGDRWTRFYPYNN